MAAEVLQHLEQGQLYKMVRQEGLTGDDDDSSKKLIESLREAIEEIGINHVTENMTKKTLDSLIEPLKLDIAPEKPAKQVSKSVIRKRIATLVGEGGLTKFFSKMADEPLNEFFEAAPSDEEKDEGKKKFPTQVARLVAEVGLQVFFSRFDVGFLQDLMETCKLKYDTNNQNALAQALALQKNATKEKKKPSKTPKFSSKKLPIAKGITYQDIFQHYYADDLHEFCKENDIKHSGTKKEIINRILAFVNDADESVKVGSPKRKRSSSASRSKKATSKKSSKKSTKKSDEEEDDKEEKDDKKEDKKESKEKSSEKGEKDEKDEKEDKKKKGSSSKKNKKDDKKDDKADEE